MRLRVVEEGHTEERKKFLDIVKEMIGQEAPSVIKTNLYRPEFFGLRFTELTGAAMRGDSEWTAGERELFAGFTSRVNQCPF